MSCNQYTGQAYECCVAVKNFNNLIDTFHNELQKVAQDQASWDRWNNIHSDWENKKGAYSHWQDTYTSLQNEKRDWNTCIVWTNVFNHNDWCQTDTGFGNQVGAEQSNCAYGSGKGICQRTSDQVQTAWQQSGYYQDEPKTDPQDSSKVWIKTSRPPDPSFNGQSQIVCCSQSFDNLTAGGKINISDISQKCSATMNNTSPPSNSTPAPSNSTPSTPTASTPQTSNSISKNGLTTNDIILVLIFILVFSLIISLTGSSVIYLGTN